jgi:type I restriction enzyme S subunit
MERYDSYKDSGVEWIGEIPTNWKSKRFSYSIDIQKGKIPKNLTDKKLVDSLPYLSMGVLRGDEPLEFSNESGVVYVSKGDIGLLWDGSNSGEVIRINREGILSSTVSLLSLKDDSFDKEFSFYLFKFYENDFRENTIGMGIPHVSGDHVRESKLIIPPIKEQKQIVLFLDTKTSLIDSLIEKTQQKIELLKEKRTSLINELVTKGLNPNVEMKDSGVKWIGKIPSHWKTSKLGFYTTKIGSGSTPKGGSEVYVDSGIPFIRSQNVHFDGLRLENISHIETETHKSMKGSIVIKDDVLLNITGGSIGRCCIVQIDGEMNVNQHVSIIRPTIKLKNYFLNFILSCDLGQSQVRFNISGGNREGLTIEGIRNFQITLPPISEQKQIVKYLDEQTQLIDNTISIEEKRIELLKEYRQSLISEVVTGKRKVV